MVLLLLNYLLPLRLPLLLRWFEVLQMVLLLLQLAGSILQKLLLIILFIRLQKKKLQNNISERPISLSVTASNSKHCQIQVIGGGRVRVCVSMSEGGGVEVALKHWTMWPKSEFPYKQQDLTKISLLGVERSSLSGWIMCTLPSLSTVHICPYACLLVYPFLSPLTSLDGV